LLGCRDIRAIVDERLREPVQPATWFPRSWYMPPASIRRRSLKSMCRKPGKLTCGWRSSRSSCRSSRIRCRRSIGGHAKQRRTVRTNPHAGLLVPAASGDADFSLASSGTRRIRTRGLGNEVEIAAHLGRAVDRGSGSRTMSMRSLRRWLVDSFRELSTRRIPRK